MLRIDVSKLDRLLAPENYRVWTNDKGREIQQPLKWLAQVHRACEYEYANRVAEAGDEWQKIFGTDVPRMP